VVASFGQCKASLRNGQPCRVVIEAERSEFCPHHSRLAEKHGADAVLNGAVPRRRPLRVVDEVTAGIVGDIVKTTTNVPIAITPANVRPMLAEAAAENAEQLKASLLEAAGSAVRPVWLSVECSHCGERSRVEAPVPDVRSRVAAIELLLREGLGRPPQAEENHDTRLPSSAAAVEKMGWRDLQAFAATLFISELTDAERDGAEADLRSRVAALPEGMRSALRSALASCP
jgi:hypothetical protein